MTTEEQLLDRLELWLALQPEPPTIFDVCATKDGQLLAAFVLKAARGAARDAVLGRFVHAAATTFDGGEMSATAALFRVWDRLSRAWSLSEAEQTTLLGLEAPSALHELRGVAESGLPTEVIERVAILLDIFEALNILLPRPEAADGWIRKPNRAPGFAGEAALDLMLDRGLPGLREVRAYLQSNVH